MTDDVQNIANAEPERDQPMTLPVMSPTAGPDVVDIRKLYAQASVFTYDPGFTSTAACDSAPSPSSMVRPAYCCTEATRSISWPRKAHYLEVCFLLLNGQLANCN